MIPMHPHLTSQLIADRQAGLMVSAQQRLARQARAARRAPPAQRGRAAPMLAALGRLARRRSSPRTIQTLAAGPDQAAPTLTPR
jgi:FtsP/CotA-like multicopper oxidase with cupredoxin domain